MKIILINQKKIFLRSLEKNDKNEKDEIVIDEREKNLDEKEKEKKIFNSIYQYI